MQISASDQVAAWLCALPPEGKHRVRMALRALAKGQGEIKPLQGPLEGFNRLRIGGRRIIYCQVASDRILLEYANTRDVIYELFERILAGRSVDG